jgi:hypothetical protein
MTMDHGGIILVETNISNSRHHRGCIGHRERFVSFELWQYHCFYVIECHPNPLPFVIVAGGRVRLQSNKKYMLPIQPRQLHSLNRGAIFS